MAMRSRSLTVLSLVLIAGVPSVRGSAHAQEETKETPTVVHSRSSLVQVDVVVRKKGKPIEGMSQAQFHVFEDGKEQKVVSFEEVKEASVMASPLSALPRHFYSNRTQNHGQPTLNVVLIDMLNTPLKEQRDMRRQMSAYFADLRQTDPVAIFVLRSRLELVKGFGTDAEETRHALVGEKAQAQRSPWFDFDQDDSASLQRIAEDLGGGSAGKDQDFPALAEARAAMQAMVSSSMVDQIDVRVRLTLSALNELARYLGGYQGRKNLIWFSSSFPISVDASMLPTSNDPRYDLTRQYGAEVRDTDALLAASRVAVYPIDPHGLESEQAYRSFDPQPAQYGARSSVPAPMSAGDENDRSAKISTQSTMREMAQATGGRAQMDTNDLRGALAEAIKDGQHYYTLAYTPPRSEDDGRSHKIEVKVDDGLDLAYRREYIADKNGGGAHSPLRLASLIVATLPGAPPATQIPFSVRVLPSSDPALASSQFAKEAAGALSGRLTSPSYRAIADLKIDPAAITLLAGQDSLHSGALALGLIAYDAEFHLLNYSIRSANVSLDDAALARVLKSGMTARLALDLPESPVQLYVVVQDLSNGRSGSVRIPLDKDAEAAH